MALSDLKAKLDAVKTAIKTSVTAVATELIEKAKARAADRLAKADKAKEQKYLLDALPGTKEEKAKRLEEIELAMAEYQELCKLQNEAEIEHIRAGKAAPADRDQLLATAKAMWDEIRSEVERTETDPDMKFFGWLRRLESQTETNPNDRVSVEEIDRAIKDGLLREITGERAREIQEAVKETKEEGRDNREERQAPFFWVRVKPHGNTPQGQKEPDDHFRYISGGVDFYARSVEGARKRLVFFALQGFRKAVAEAKTAAWEATKEIKKNSYISLADIAAGKTGQAWAEVTAANPWRPTFIDKATGERKPIMDKSGKEIVNFGPVVVESSKAGVFQVLNVSSGMYHSLRLAGAWNEEGKPVEFRFFAGVNPRNGSPNNFAGLKPVKDVGDPLPAEISQRGRLRAILCLAGGLTAPVREEKTNGGGGGISDEMPPEAVPDTRRGYRSDGTKADEPRKGKEGGGRKRNRKGTDEEVPEVPRGVLTAADAADLEE